MVPKLLLSPAIELSFRPAIRGGSLYAIAWAAAARSLRLPNRVAC
jgi:hypothetical protein